MTNQNKRKLHSYAFGQLVNDWYDHIIVECMRSAAMFKTLPSFGYVVDEPGNL